MRSRANHHFVYLLLFFEAVFLVFQFQDGVRATELFAFVPAAVLDGEIWRVLTYQFVDVINRTTERPGLIGFFFSVLILYIMGNALEEEWGTFDFAIFWLLSVLGAAAIAFVLGAYLLGSLFLMYSLLFAYAVTYPEMTFYLFFVLPVKVKWIAWVFLAVLAFGVIRLQPASLAAAGGTFASMAWFWYRHGRFVRGQVPRPKRALVPERPPIDVTDERKADTNLALFDRVEKTLATGTPEEVEALRSEIAKSIVPGVNICPPPDYKPRGEDRYCIRCEGFPECTVRFIKLAGEQDEERAPSSRA